MSKKKTKKNAKTASTKNAPQPVVLQQNGLERLLNGTRFSTKQISIFFFLFATLLYINTTANDFSVDDYLVTENHPLVTQGIKGIPEILKTPYMNDARTKGEFRPITQITYAFEYQFFGKNPHVNHFFNAILYGVLCLLIFKLFTKIFGEQQQKYILLGVFIFIIHPIHTEVVASLKNRENLLGAIFGILACFQALKYLEKKKWKSIFWGAVLLLLSIATKVDGFIYCFYIALIIFYKSESPAKSWKKIAFVFGSALFILLLFILYRRQVLQHGQFRNTEYHETPLVGEAKNYLNRVKLGTSTLWWYLRLNIFPYPLRFYYGTGLINIPQWSNPIVWLSILANGALFFFGLKGLRKKSFFSFNILWYLAGVFLFSQLVEVVTGIVAERHIFSASIGSCMVMSFSLVSLYEYLKKKQLQTFIQPLVIVVGLTFCVSIFYVLHRNRIWKDANTLYANDIQHLHQSIFANFEVANNFSRDATKHLDNIDQYVQELDQSIKYYKVSLKQFPEHPAAWYNMGVSYLRLSKKDATDKGFQQLKEAQTCFKKCIQYDSIYKSVHYLVGLTQIFTGDTTAAIQSFRKELEIRPNDGNAVEALYKLYTKKGNPQAVIDLTEGLVAKGIHSKRIYKAMANAYYLKGDVKKAMAIRKMVMNYPYEDNDVTDW